MKNLRAIHVLAAFLLSAAVLVTGCKKDDPVSPPEEQNPQELITTLILSLTDTAGVAPGAEAIFRDLDGPGGNAPTIDTMKVQSGVVYQATILLLDQTKTPADTISHEVEEEGLSHRFWFTVGGGAAGRITVTYLDEDEGNPPLPIGLETQIAVSAGGTTTGTYQVVLKHYEPASLKRSDTNGTLGETDIDVTFPVQIQ
ncbi:MAG: hypothetical protein KF749_10415 [Bacteroidetes bacterium]|nr:hypothetical protein [Bacteroidota bacterium]MCW5895821.1 hypothetical protein [Bacteroidota bacterium]